MARACQWVASGPSPVHKPNDQADVIWLVLGDTHPSRNTDPVSTWGLCSQTRHLTYMFNHQEGAVALPSKERESNRKALGYHRTFARYQPDPAALAGGQSMRRILWVACAFACLAPTLSLAQGMSQVARTLDKRDKSLLEHTVGLNQSPTRLIVRFKSDASDNDRASARASVKATLLHRSGLVQGLEVLDSDVGAPNAVTALKHNPHVLYAEFDSVVRPDSIPNDHQFNLLWALNDSPGYNIHAPEAWNIFTGDPNFVIADIDTGMQLDNIDLAANLYTNQKEIAGNGIDDDGDGYIDDIHGWDFYDNTNDPTDLDGHGTHTAGTIGAVGNNALGIAGVNWQCKIMPLKFIGPNGGYTSDAIRALEYAVKLGVKVSNNSWGNSTYEQSLYDAIDAAKAAGHLFVAGAGNGTSNNDTAPFYPASYANDNIISVAAVDSTGALASFSNFGATTVDIAAPGVGIYSTVPGNNLASKDGTSMATPHVAGVAALLWGHEPSLTWQGVKSRILLRVQATAALSGKCVSGGLLDAYSVLSNSPVPPKVSIIAPASSAMLSQPEVLLVGRAYDGVDGDISKLIVWRDSSLGQIAQGTICFTGNLSVGPHVVSASVTDSRGLTESSTTTIQVSSPGPTVSGLSMTPSLSYPEGSLVSLTASAADPTYGSLTSAIKWSSSIQGALGQGGALSYGGFAVGTHVVTATAANSMGVGAGQPTVVTIIPATSAPSAPTNAAASKYSIGTVSAVHITWTDTSNNEACFDIETSFKTGTKTWSAGIILPNSPWANTTLYNDGPTSGYTWRYRVRSRNSVGVSAWSNYTSSIKM